MTSRYSSTRPASCRVWARPQLPCTWSSPPGFAFSCSTAATTSPAMTEVLCHDGSRRVLETTCLGRVFSFAATRSSGSVTVRPEGVHHVVGRPAEEDLVGLGEPAADDGAEVLVDERDDPAALVEPAGAVLVRSAGSLHDAVEAEERVQGELHVVSFSVLAGGPSAALTYSTNGPGPIGHPAGRIFQTWVLQVVGCRVCGFGM